ncbi:glycosyltransferase [Candidatus Roizmanbacteria bacterium]|nr:glycosyltransferase [Candidatus Roizmanbacteria bacterium]
MITVYTVTYNEELLIQFMINHYRQRFPGCRIVVYDNISTDKTVQIALANDCELVSFNTNGQYQEGRQIQIRNTCWKDASTDWVLVCDMDELLDIHEEELKTEEASGTSIIRSEVYDMINLEDTIDIAGMKYGVKGCEPGKFCLFNKKLIIEINYGPGSHTCNPKGNVTYSKKAYKLYHFNSINENVTIEKFKIRAARSSLENVQNGWGMHYFMTPEEIRHEYATERKKAIKVR